MLQDGGWKVGLSGYKMVGGRLVCHQVFMLQDGGWKAGVSCCKLVRGRLIYHAVIKTLVVSECKLMKERRERARERETPWTWMSLVRFASTFIVLVECKNK